MKKKVAQQIEELSVQERKTIFRAGMLREKIGAALIVVVLLIFALSFWNWMQAKQEEDAIWDAFFLERIAKGESPSIDYNITWDEAETAAAQADDARRRCFFDWFICSVALLFYTLSSTIYLRKNVPHYTGRRFSYLLWSKKRRKRLLEQ